MEARGAPSWTPLEVPEGLLGASGRVPEPFEVVVASEEDNGAFPGGGGPPMEIGGTGPGAPSRLPPLYYIKGLLKL